MFRDAHRCLNAGGELRVVFNRHLSYLAVLRRLFGTVEVVSKHPILLSLDASKVISAGHRLIGQLKRSHYSP